MLSSNLAQMLAGPNNRSLNEQKSQGNIIVFRNLKNRTQEAITLFRNKEALK